MPGFEPIVVGFAGEHFKFDEIYICVCVFSGFKSGLAEVKLFDCTS